jgi:hypothetical protein
MAAPDNQIGAVSTPLRPKRIPLDAFSKSPGLPGVFPSGTSSPGTRDRTTAFRENAAPAFRAAFTRLATDWAAPSRSAIGKKTTQLLSKYRPYYRAVKTKTRKTAIFPENIAILRTG